MMRYKSETYSSQSRTRNGPLLSTASPIIQYKIMSIDFMILTLPVLVIELYHSSLRGTTAGFACNCHTVS